MITFLKEFFRTRKAMQKEERIIDYVIDDPHAPKYRRARFYLYPDDVVTLEQVKRAMIQKDVLTLNQSGYLRLATEEESRIIDRKERERYERE